MSVKLRGTAPKHFKKLDSASFVAVSGSYLLRAGSLMSSFLATMPVWNNFDPVAILTKPDEDKKNSEDASEQEEAAKEKAEEMFG